MSWKHAIAFILAAFAAHADCRYDCAVRWEKCNARCMKDGGKGACFRACDTDKDACDVKCGPLTGKEK